MTIIDERVKYISFCYHCYLPFRTTIVHPYAQCTRCHSKTTAWAEDEDFDMLVRQLKRLALCGCGHIWFLRKHQNTSKRPHTRYAQCPKCRKQRIREQFFQKYVNVCRRNPEAINKILGQIMPDAASRIINHRNKSIEKHESFMESVAESTNIKPDGPTFE